MKVLLRRGRLEDVEKARSLARKMAEDLDVFDASVFPSLQDFQSAFDSGTVRIIAAALEDRLVGAVWYNSGVNAGYEVGEYLAGIGVFVEAEFRGKKLGLNLGVAMSRIALLEGFERVQFDSPGTDLRLLDWYRRTGHRNLKKEKDLNVFLIEEDKLVELMQKEHQADCLMDFTLEVKNIKRMNGSFLKLWKLSSHDLRVEIIMRSYPDFLIYTGWMLNVDIDEDNCIGLDVIQVSQMEAFVRTIIQSAEPAPTRICSFITEQSAMRFHLYEIGFVDTTAGPDKWELLFLDKKGVRDQANVLIDEELYEVDIH